MYGAVVIDCDRHIQVTVRTYVYIMLTCALRVDGGALHPLQLTSTGCEGGAGKFTTTLDQKGVIVDVGAIPAGKWNVKIRLAATADVDV